MAGAAEARPVPAAVAVRTSAALRRARPAVPMPGSQGWSAWWLRWSPPALQATLTALAWALHQALGPVAAAPWGALPGPGLALVALGTAWAGWALWQLYRAGTTWDPRGEPTVLVEEGPYRFGRHPLYLGLALLPAGAGLALGAPLLLAAAAAFAAIVQRVHIAHEEARLARHFGGWYSDYAAQVRRWL